MYKVFLVEDEVIMRNGIKNNISWEAEGFSFVGEAGDGELALPLIKKHKPDILITDIKMPFMDGLELSKMVRQELPDTKIIFLSGYGEFDYARHAIQVGAADYLLKPVNAAMLLAAVHKVADQIDKERAEQQVIAQYQREMKEYERLEQKKFFRTLIAGHLTTGELIEKGRELKLDLVAAAYAVLLFKVTSVSGEQLQEITARIKEVPKEGAVLLFDREPEGWIFLCKGEGDSQVEEVLEWLCRELKDIVADYPGVGYFGGIGSVEGRLSEVKHSYENAGRAFARRYFSEESMMIGANRVAAENLSFKNIQETRVTKAVVQDFLKNGLLDEIDNFLASYIEGIGEQNQNSLLFGHYMIVEFYLCVKEFLESQGIHYEELSDEVKDMEEISQMASSIAVMRMHLHRLLFETLTLRDQVADKKYSDLLLKAENYMKEHYQSNGISLNSVADYVGISPSYFSTIFSQEMGRTFSEYLTTLRMEKAKELLMCTGMKSTEIGYEVGYKDSHYFSYIFKKTQKCTPKEYRMRKNGKGDRRE